MPANRPNQSVIVEAPARLHLGFLDLSGSLGRRFGSLGLALDGLSTRITARAAGQWSAHGLQSERAQRCLEALRDALGLRDGVEVEVEHAIPAHAGLGSGTQLALAVGKAVATLDGLTLGPREVARLLDRGARSGIGVGAFEQGGFLVDGGRGADDAPPPIVSRIAFPAQWRAILIFDHAARGLHGADEIAAFRALPPFPDADAAHLCRLVLMRALPCLCEGDLSGFGAAIGELQRIVGDHFAPAQGGRFASPRVTEALAFFERQGVSCLGQSSWGPTGFAIVDSESRALSLVREAQGRLDAAQIGFAVHRARNRGAHVWVASADKALEPTAR